MVSSLAVAAIAAVVSASPARPTKIAVLQVKPLEPGLAKTSELIQEVILADLAQLKGVESVGQSDIAAMLGLERQKQLLGCAEASSECLAELAGALDADYALVGTLAKLDREQRLDLKLLDTRGNRVTGRDFVMAASDAQLVSATREMLSRLVRKIPAVETANAAVASSSAGPAFQMPWHFVALGVGAAATLGGGAWAGWTVSDYEQQRRSLTITQATAFEGRRNAGLIVGGVGLAIAAGGAALWLLQPAGTTASAGVIPLNGGAAVVIGGSL